jgi:hypothetical protein
MKESNLKHLSEIRAILSKAEDDRVLKAAAYMLQHMVVKKPPAKTQLTIEVAQDCLLQLVTNLLNTGEYAAAAKLIWGDELVTVEPRGVQMIWREIPKQAKMIVLGAGSLGKSYTLAIWILLDWIRDPTMTCVKVLSVTEEHAKRNVFAAIKNLHMNAAFPLPGDRKEKSIQVGEDAKQGIHLMTIPMGDEGKGRLRGFHPVPRSVPHLQFGTLSRIRVILDEAEEIPEGVWEDVDNILITLDGVEHVKIFCATNPKDKTSRLGQRAEPVNGWPTVNIEESESWPSRLGWWTLRLDGAKCENVTERKVVFPGLLTWDGYQQYLSLGDTSPQYFTMARGWFPDKGLNINAIPADFVETCRGAFLFQGTTTYCAAVDLAFEGGDMAIMTIGRYGRVVGWTPTATPTPKPIIFPKPQDGIQIEQQFELNRTHTLDMVKQIMDVCKNLKIPPAWLCVDRTGNGTGVHDALVIQFGPEVLGVNFGEKATEVRVLDDDKEKASDLYSGIVTELFFATRKFMEFHYLKFSAALKLPVLTRELTTRRYKQAGQGLVRIESKKEYKARGYDSPDHADSLTLLVHLVRMQGEFVAAMVPGAEVKEGPPVKTGVVDRLTFIDFNA